jgi:trehalose/maltose hydrolase-like predicted phosphorylase
VYDRAGQVIPIRTGLLEEHVTADVAWATACYVDWTGDEEFAAGPGRELLVETARYWVSRIRLGPDGRGHIYGVIGPDEYHEPVDDNVYTNVMARWNLRRAAELVARVPSSVAAEERESWLRAAASLVDGYDPETGLYEQFAGFFALEPLVVEEVLPRRPMTAEVLIGRKQLRRTQILKQTDVLMLHHLVPEEVAPGSLQPNLLFYESRTTHGSSLSPGIHAALFARAGMLERAVEILRTASRIDLDDLTGTTAEGLHLATMGSVWHALALGFAGLRPTREALQIDPRLPTSWAALELRVRFRGSSVRLHLEQAAFTVTADPQATVWVVGTSGPVTAGPAGACFERRGDGWAAV